MTEYDYELLHDLFDNLCVFSGELHGDAFRDDEELEDCKGKDISTCTELSIFKKLKEEVKSGNFGQGENESLIHFRKFKKGNKTVGAKGIVQCSMDWSDPDEPYYIYEFAHFEKDGEVEEYLREMNVDEIVVDKFLEVENYTVNIDSEGCEESRTLIQRVIDNSEDLSKKEKIKYKCLLEATREDGEYFELWKMGYAYHGEPHLFILTGQNFFRTIGEGFIDSFLNLYLHDEPLKTFDGCAALSEEELSELQIWEDENWYHGGKYLFNPLKPVDVIAPEDIEERLDPIYPPADADRQATVELIDALKTVKSDIAGDYAKKLIERIKKGYELQTGERIEE